MVVVGAGGEEEEGSGVVGAAAAAAAFEGISMRIVAAPRGGVAVGAWAADEAATASCLGERGLPWGDKKAWVGKRGGLTATQEGRSKRHSILLMGWLGQVYVSLLCVAGQARRTKI